VADVDAGGQRDTAASDMGDVLQAHRDLKGVFGINDDSALGALTAIKTAGIANKIAVIGYDASPEARTAIASGAMYGDAIQYPDQIGAKTIDTIHDFLTGKRVTPVVKVSVGSFTAADAKKAK
jgi:ribose transport system substrate-binding protein